MFGIGSKMGAMGAMGMGAMGMGRQTMMAGPNVPQLFAQILYVLELFQIETRSSFREDSILYNFISKRISSVLA